MLEDLPERVGGAVAAVADAKHGEGVVVHCFAGKDRTGIVSALLLSLAGVPDELIAADYAASDPGVELLSTPWFESARDETELTIRRRVSTSPRAAMLDVLAWLHETAGGPDEYLRSAGLSDVQLATSARAARRRAERLLAAARLARARCDTACARCSSSSPSGSSCPLPPPCSSARASSQSASSGFRGSSGPWR